MRYNRVDQHILVLFVLVYYLYPIHIKGTLYWCPTLRSLALSVRDVTSSPSRHLFSWFLLISANVLWAASYVAAKFALRDTTVNVMLALRITIASLVLLPWLLSRR